LTEDSRGVKASAEAGKSCTGIISLVCGFVVVRGAEGGNKKQGEQGDGGGRSQDKGIRVHASNRTYGSVRMVKGLWGVIAVRILATAPTLGRRGGKIGEGRG